MNKGTVPAIVTFEQQVWQRRNAEALETLVRIFGTFSGTGGRLPAPEEIPPGVALPGRFSEEITTRFAAAITELLARPDCIIDAKLFSRLIVHHRWLGAVYAGSSFGNTDFLMNRLGLLPTADFIASATPHDLCKMAILYGAESSLPMDFTLLFRRAPQLACSLAIAILSGRLLTTPKAHQKREILLKWITEALDKLESPAGLPTEIFADLWMHCSYGVDRDKHALKRPLNALIRRQIQDAGLSDPELKSAGGKRPTVLVMLEWFHETHSIMRTHSISMRTLKEHYRLVGFGPKGMVDEAGQAVFDEFHFFGQCTPNLDFIRPVLEVVGKEKPVATYFPSVGMALHTLYLVNMRLAPCQVIALGHPATTHSDKIDHVLVEEDYVGDETLFSENVVRVPKNALPYFRPSTKLNEPERKLGTVRIAVPTAIMKLNPEFLQACRTISETARHVVEFHFLLGGAPDLMHLYAEKAISAQVPGAVVHKTAKPADYLQNVNACDLFANPFPFGNTNGIVDTVYCGLPGVCFSGDEVHSHIDEGMFRRMGFPEWTITRTVEDYVSAVLRLVDDPELRNEMASKIKSEKADDVLYVGNPSAFADAFRSLV